MRTKLLPAVSAALSLCACSLLSDGGEGTLEINFAETRPSAEVLPDKEDFILKVCDSKGNQLYFGRFADSPEEFHLPSGSYSIGAMSAEFTEPAFDAPQYADSIEVSLRAGEKVSATLCCRQANSGVKLIVDKSFKENFPDGLLHLEGRDGRLPYPYGEQRTAFFKPGRIMVSMEDAGETSVLFSKSASAGDILSLKLISSQDGGGGGIDIKIDSSRNRVSETYDYSRMKGNTPDDPIEPGEVLDNVGRKSVWVKGYVVGCATGSRKYSFTPPFSKDSNLLLGPRTGTSESKYCIAVELKSGPVREELNLVDNPSLLGRAVCLKGDPAESYYGLPGLKNVSECQIQTR